MAKIPEIVLRNNTEAAATSAAKRIRSHSRYFFVLTLAAASLVIISGAVAQRLWTVRSKALTARAVSAPSPQLIAPNDAHPITDPEPPTRVSTSTGEQARPASTELSASSAGQPPVQRIAVVPSSAIHEVATSPPPIESTDSPIDVESRHPSARLRVFLAPRSVIYPSIPSSALSADQKKEILVTAVVGADGAVQDVQVPAENPSLVKPIARTVKHWRYEPYLVNGRAVEVETRMIFTLIGSDAIAVRFLPPGEMPPNE